MAHSELRFLIPSRPSDGDRKVYEKASDDFLESCGPMIPTLRPFAAVSGRWSQTGIKLMPQLPYLLLRQGT